MTNPKHTSSDLVAEIRKEAAIQIGFDGPAYQTLTRWADRIEALEAENERLREVLEPFARAQHIVASVDGERIRCVLTYPPEAKQTFTLASLNEARAALRGTSHDA